MTIYAPRGVSGHDAGNPLALKMVAAGIQELLDNNISEFLSLLEQGMLFFDDIQDCTHSPIRAIANTSLSKNYWQKFPKIL